MITDESKEVVANSPLFKGLNSNQISTLSETAKELTFDSGQIIMKEGERSGDIYVIVDGEVQIEKKYKDSEEAKVIHTRKEGDTLGEMSLIDMQKRSATVRATSAVKVVVLDNEEMSTLFDQAPGILATMAINIARTLSERLREADELIT